jgi:hypothetical protein
VLVFYRVYKPNHLPIMPGKRLAEYTVKGSENTSASIRDTGDVWLLLENGKLDEQWIASY